LRQFIEGKIENQKNLEKCEREINKNALEVTKGIQMIARYDEVLCEKA
jgi:hypothetical protein